MPSPIGEIVETSLISFTAEAPASQLYASPPFGSFLRSESPDGSETVYGVVASAETASIEPNRRAAAYWQSEEELRKTQPQIFELLSTRFTALIVAHLEEGNLRFRLPPRPPRIHGFVYGCSKEEIRQLAGNTDLIRPLLAAAAASDDLVAAALRHGAATQNDPQGYLTRAGKHLAVLLRDDYPRLQAIIRKLA